MAERHVVDARGAFCPGPLMELIDLAVDFGFKKLVPCRSAERFEVLYRSRIGGQDLQRAARGHLLQRLLGAQDGERTIESLRVEYLIGHFAFSAAVK